jgi:DNA-binding ferritin-like protein|tara:strand:+ start:113 stop:403 length:291 start_codon:yes stop_codon:yes gene_type:complete
MEQIILAFGLGIMLVSNIVLVYVVLKSNKKVNEYEEDIRKFKKDLDDRYIIFDQMVRDLGGAINEIDRRVDSRTDKLDARVMMELERFKRTYIKDY